MTPPVSRKNSGNTETRKIKKKWQKDRKRPQPQAAGEQKNPVKGSEEMTIECMQMFLCRRGRGSSHMVTPPSDHGPRDGVDRVA